MCALICNQQCSMERNNKATNHPKDLGRGYYYDWAAANGGLRGVWPSFLEISRNRTFSPFFSLCRTFLEGAKSIWEIQKSLFPKISSELLKPPSLKPPFAALQYEARNVTQILRKQFFCVTDVCIIGILLPRQLMCVIGTRAESTLWRRPNYTK